MNSYALERKKAHNCMRLINFGFFIIVIGNIYCYKQQHNISWQCLCQSINELIKNSFQRYLCNVCNTIGPLINEQLLLHNSPYFNFKMLRRLLGFVVNSQP